MMELRLLELVLWTIRFLFGACVFYFLDMAARRLSSGEKRMKRSAYGLCGRMLSAFLGGAAVWMCGIYFGWGSWGQLSFPATIIFLFLCILLVVALIDWDTQIIYDRFHIMILALSPFHWVLFSEHQVGDRILGALIISLPMLLLALMIPGAFGGGDIKLAAVCGLFLGTAPIVCGTFLALLIGGVYGASMLMGKKLKRKDSFAFGPFLAIGYAVAAFAGDAMAAWYLRFL